MQHTTEFDEIVVFGGRGTALMILTGLEEIWKGRVRIRAVIDDTESGHTHGHLGVPVISSEQRRAQCPNVPVLLAVGSPGLRAETAARLAQEGAVFATVATHGQLRVDPSVTFGAGAVAVPHVRLGPDVKIGAGAQVLSTIVAHDSIIGDYSTLGIYSSVLGHVVIGKGVNIAPNAMIANGTRDRPLHIGDGAIIGVGAVVARDVPAGARMVGNPAMTVDRWKAFSQFLDGHIDESR